MKKLLLLVVLSFSTTLFAQTFLLSGISFGNLNGTAVLLANAQVAVCTIPTNSAPPCNTPATIYAVSAAGTCTTNVIAGGIAISDVNGKYSFCGIPGTYAIESSSEYFAATRSYVSISTDDSVSCPPGQYCLTTMTGYSDACAALNAFRSNLISSGVTDADINATAVFTGTVYVSTACWATVPTTSINNWSEHDHFAGDLKLVTPVNLQVVPTGVTVEAPMAFIWPVDHLSQYATTTGAQFIAATAASGPLLQIGTSAITSTDPRGSQLKSIGVNCIDPTGTWNAGSIGIQNGYSQENTGGDFVMINGCAVGLDLENFSPNGFVPPATLGGSQNSAQWRHLIIESAGVPPLPTTSVGLVKVLTSGAGQTPGTYTSNAVGGGGTGAQASYTVSSGGMITSASLVTPGSGYTSEPYFPVAPVTTGSPGSLSTFLTPTWVGVMDCSNSPATSGGCTQSRGIQDSSIIGPTGNCVACYGVMADGDNLSLSDIGIEQEEDAILVGSRYQAYVNISNVFGQGTAGIVTDMRSVVHVTAPNSSSTVVLNNVGGTNQRDSFTFMDDINPAHNMCSNIDLNPGSPCSASGASVASVAVTTPGSGQTNGTYQVYSDSGPEGGWAQIILTISGGLCTQASVIQYGYGFSSAPTFTAPTTTGTPCTLTATLGPVASSKLIRSIAYLGCNTQTGYGTSWSCSSSSAVFPSEISITGNAGSATTASACPTCTGGVTATGGNYTLNNSNQSQLVNMSPTTSAGITGTLPAIPANSNWWTTLWNGSPNYPLYLATSGPNINGSTTQATLPPLTSVRIYSNGTSSYYSPDLPNVIVPTALTAQSGSTGDVVLACRSGNCPVGIYSITFYVTVTTAATGGGTLAPYCKYNNGTAAEIETLASISTLVTGGVVANCTVLTTGSDTIKWGVALTGTATSLQYSVVVAVGNTQGMGANPPGVTSINSTAGAFTFTGTGVSCSGTGCTFSGGGGTTTNALTFAATGGAAPGSTFNGSAAATVSPTTIGAQAALTNPVTGPGSGATVGDVALIGNTSGTSITDGGFVPASLASPTFTGTMTTASIAPAAPNTSYIGNNAYWYKSIYLGDASYYVSFNAGVLTGSYQIQLPPSASTTVIIPQSLAATTNLCVTGMSSSTGIFTTQNCEPFSGTTHGVKISEGAATVSSATAAGALNMPLIGQGSSADPIFSTIAYPTSLTSGGVLYASSTTAIAGGGILNTNILTKGSGAGAAPTNSSITDDGKNITSTEVFVGGNKVFVTGDFTDSTSATLMLVTGLSYTLPTTKAVNVSFHCMLLFDQATAAVSDSIGIGVTGTAPTQANAAGTVYTNTTASTNGTLTALASTTPTAVVTFMPSAITTIWSATLDGTIEQPSNATPGVFGIYVSTTTGTDNLIVKRGSYCTIW